MKKKNGIKCILPDLDNTIAPYKTKEPDKKLKELIASLERDFKIIILSNGTKRRVRPFKEKLNVDSAHSSKKPFKGKYKKIKELYKFEENEIACIGDQLITDIYGANKLDITSILVNPLTEHDYTITFVNRLIEKIIYDRLSKKDLLIRGKYYE